jgi:hypothetical protein
MIYRKINELGYFVEDVILDGVDTIPNNFIEIKCPSGFYAPKWDGKKWVEGLAQDAILLIQSNKDTETTTEEQIENLANQVMLAQEALDFLIMGGM